MERKSLLETCSGHAQTGIVSVISGSQGPQVTSKPSVGRDGELTRVSSAEPERPTMEKSWHCYLCVQAEVATDVVADHEYLGLVMINGTSVCLFHARRRARRILSRPQLRSSAAKAIRPPRRALQEDKPGP